MQRGFGPAAKPARKTALTHREQNGIGFAYSRFQVSRPPRVGAGGAIVPGRSSGGGGAGNRGSHEKLVFEVAFGRCRSSGAWHPRPAHHGTSAYDTAKLTTVKGTVAEFQFINPHVIISVDAPGRKGQGRNVDLRSQQPERFVQARLGPGHDQKRGPDYGDRVSP